MRKNLSRISWYPANPEPGSLQCMKRMSLLPAHYAWFLRRNFTETRSWTEVSSARRRMFLNLNRCRSLQFTSELLNDLYRLSVGHSYKFLGLYFRLVLFLFFVFLIIIYHGYSYFNSWILMSGTRIITVIAFTSPGPTSFRQDKIFPQKLCNKQALCLDNFSQ